MKKKWSVLMFLFSISISCIEGGGDSDSDDDSSSDSSSDADDNIHDIEAFCNKSDADSCDADLDGDTMIATWYTDYDCNGSPNGNGVAVSSVEIECDSSICSGEFDVWFEDTSFDDQVTSLSEGDYGVIAYIDVNGNNDYDSGEPSACNDIEVTEDGDMSSMGTFSE